VTVSETPLNFNNHTGYFVLPIAVTVTDISSFSLLPLFPSIAAFLGFVVFIVRPLFSPVNILWFVRSKD
jgi:hypothetical protein